MEGTIGEIRMFAANFAPQNWAYCQAQLLAIATNQAMFSILGTTYGGNGIQTFGLPDFRGRAPIGAGQNYILGQFGGTESTALTINNIPLHTHVMSGTIKMKTTAAAANDPSPVGHYFANDTSTKYNSTNNGAIMKPLVSTLALGSLGNTPVNNLQPYLAMNYIICLYGIFPSRN